MQRLLEGIAKFQREVFPQKRHLFEQLANGQNPEALFITCADSRIVPDLITQSGPGELFICRNAGNMVPPYGEVNGGVSATIEYAVSALGVRNVIVCGHSHCGAMKALLHPEELQHLPTVKSWLAHGEVARRVVMDAYPKQPEDQTVELLAHENVVAQLDNLRTHPSIASKLARGDVTLHGWMYEIPTGRLEAWDAQRGAFVPIEQYSLPVSAPRARLANILARAS
jgi:carbonic anhydrase